MLVASSVFSDSFFNLNCKWLVPNRMSLLIRPLLVSVREKMNQMMTLNPREYVASSLGCDFQGFLVRDTQTVGRGRQVEKTVHGKEKEGKTEEIMRGLSFFVFLFFSFLSLSKTVWCQHGRRGVT